MILTIGTKNQAKLDQIRSAVATLGVEVRGLPSDKYFPEIKEHGQTALQNARTKALAYARLIGQPVFSMDNALYLENLSVERQPGVNVRHINGRSDRPSDSEIISYYSQLIKELGGRINGYWEYGVCVAAPDGLTQEMVFRSPRIFVSEPSKVVLDGYPLESLQIDPETGRYSSEMTQAEKDEFYAERSLTGQKLREFVASLPKICYDCHN